MREVNKTVVASPADSKAEFSTTKATTLADSSVSMSTNTIESLRPLLEKLLESTSQINIMLTGQVTSADVLSQPQDIQEQLLVTRRKVEVYNVVFPRFAELPKELRDKIWWDALPGPLVIQVSWSSSKIPGRIRANIPPSPLFRACHESRHHALTRFNTRLTDATGTVSYDRFDPGTDIGMVDSESKCYDAEGVHFNSWSIWSIETSKSIERLAIDSRGLKLWLEYREYTIPAIFELENLRQLIVVVHVYHDKGLEYACERQLWNYQEEVALVDTANYALLKWWPALLQEFWDDYEEVSGVFASSKFRFGIPEVVVKLCTLNGEVCCDMESFTAFGWA